MYLKNSISEHVDSYVPFTLRRYKVDHEGNIFNEDAGLFLPTSDVVELSTEHGKVRIKYGVAVALARKMCKYPPKFWEKMGVLYIDGNVNNNTASNLVLSFPEGGIEDCNGFYLIPGYSLMRINKEGTVYSVLTDRAYQISYSENGCGYPTVRALPDIGRVRNVVVHRMLALAFLKYPAEVDSMDVNHRNGVKTDFSLSNLEWASRQQNCEHAYSTGLRADNKAVLVRNAFTKEVVEYYSLEEAARNLNVSGGAVAHRTESKGQNIYVPGLQFKLKTDVTEWKDFKNPAEEMNKAGVPRKTTVTHTVTGKEIFFNSAADAAAYLKIPKYRISWNLTRKPVYLFGEFEIRYVNHGQPD